MLKQFRKPKALERKADNRHAAIESPNQYTVADESSGHIQTAGAREGELEGLVVGFAISEWIVDPSAGEASA